MKLSVITLSWDNRDYTEKFVESIRKHTKVPCELIIVDNGSEPSTQDWVRAAADKAIIFKENQGFPKGFNAGLKAAEGEYVMMANNDTEFPAEWDIRLIETMEKYPNAGIVSPAYTSGRRIGRLEKPGNKIIKAGRFRRGPSGVAYFVRRHEMVNIFGGWSEDYPIASGEDADLCFTVWLRGYDVFVDQRVLVLHKGKVTASTKLEDWDSLYAENAKLFRKKWFYYHKFPYLARLTVKWFKQKPADKSLKAAG